MNREQRRKFSKEYRQALQSRGLAKETARLVANSEKSALPPIKTGAKVKLNQKKIQSAAGFERLNDRYKKFVSENSETVFTAKLEDDGLISLYEAPEWLFWYSDLIKIDTTEF